MRSTTLRAVFKDLATEFVEQGFKWIFVVHTHGADHQNRVLHEAGDYFRDTYGGRMVAATTRSAWASSGTRWAMKPKSRRSSKRG